MTKKTRFDLLVRLHTALLVGPHPFVLVLVIVIERRGLAITNAGTWEAYHG